jgi:hypothetical protein
VHYRVQWLCGGIPVSATFVADPVGAVCERCLDAAQPAVYRCFRVDGRLLYVGCSAFVTDRLRTHEKWTPWWPEVAAVRVERFQSRRAAGTAEVAAIKREAPLYNVQHAVTQDAA